MTKTILAALTIAIGISAGAAGASAGTYNDGIYKGAPQWVIDVFTNDRDSK